MDESTVKDGYTADEDSLTRSALTGRRPFWRAMPNVGLFVTCLVDVFRPSVGFAAVELLTAAGCEVSVVEAQTCCGQPTFNSGERRATVPLAQRVIKACEAHEHIVVPSGSCAP